MDTVISILAYRFANQYASPSRFFLCHGVNAFWAMDQWTDRSNKSVRPVSEKFIASLRMKQAKNGAWPRASDNAHAYSIIAIR
ncbi:MAG: BPSL0067 family protein [Massilia sp.]|nr:BPSL0067 family protein [Massilia sp.]